jgi:hypothetical protein
VKWQAGFVQNSRGRAIALRSGAVVALGGGGLAHLIVRLIIWHELFRLFRYLWRIPTYGPFIVIVLGLIVVGLLVWRSSRRGQRSLRWPRRGSGSSAGSGTGTGSGPRDW